MGSAVVQPRASPRTFWTGNSILAWCHLEPTGPVSYVPKVGHRWPQAVPNGGSFFQALLGTSMSSAEGRSQAVGQLQTLGSQHPSRLGVGVPRPEWRAGWDASIAACRELLKLQPARNPGGLDKIRIALSHPEFLSRRSEMEPKGLLPDQVTLLVQGPH